MPPLLDVALFRRIPSRSAVVLDFVEHQYRPLKEGDYAPVTDSPIRTDSVHAVLCPTAHSHVRSVCPPERSFGDSLVKSIHGNDVVSRRTSKPIAPFRVANVGVSSRIDKDIA